jgi:hypothetical protein
MKSCRHKTRKVHQSHGIVVIHNYSGFEVDLRLETVDFTVIIVRDGRPLSGYGCTLSLPIEVTMRRRVLMRHR